MSTKPTTKPGHGLTFHRDGTVSFWAPSLRRWDRTSPYALTNRHDDYASLTERQRERVCKAAFSR